MRATRAYASPLRAEQAAATRDRIIDATVALLQDNDVSSFSMQDVADRAGVAVRTVYRAFPTKDDLVAGVLESIRRRFDAAAGEPPTTREELEAGVEVLYGKSPLLFTTHIPEQRTFGSLVETAQRLRMRLRIDEYVVEDLGRVE